MITQPQVIHLLDDATEPSFIGPIHTPVECSQVRGGKGRHLMNHTVVDSMTARR